MLRCAGPSSTEKIRNNFRKKCYPQRGVEPLPGGSSCEKLLTCNGLSPSETGWQINNTVVGGEFP